MKKVIRLTESDLTRIVKRIIMEQTSAKEVPQECDQSTVKEITAEEGKKFQHKSGIKAWREYGAVTKYYYCKIK